MVDRLHIKSSFALLGNKISCAQKIVKFFIYLKKMGRFYFKRLKKGCTFDFYVI